MGQLTFTGGVPRSRRPIVGAAVIAETQLSLFALGSRPRARSYLVYARRRELLDLLYIMPYVNRITYT